MSRKHFAFATACLASCGLTLFSVHFHSANLHGQDTKADAKGGLPVAAAGDQVIIKREATHIEPPHKYKVTLSLEPVRSVTLTAPFDGIVRQADAKANTKLQPQADVVRLDTSIAKLQLARAEAALKAATFEQKLAADKDETYKGLAQARVDWSRAEFFWGDERAVPPNERVFARTIWCWPWAGRRSSMASNCASASAPRPGMARA